jgi:potassium efflux system protein
MQILGDVIRRCGFIILILFTMNIFALSTVSHTEELVGYLKEQEQYLQKGIASITQDPLPYQENQLKDAIRQNKILQGLNDANIVTLKNFLVTQKELQADFHYKLKQLEKYTVSGNVPASSQEKINKIMSLTDTNQQVIGAIERNLELSEKYRDLLSEQSYRLDSWQNKQISFNKIHNLNLQEQELSKSLNTLYNATVVLQKKIHVSHENHEFNLNDEAWLFYNNQMINLMQYEIAELHLERHLIRVDSTIDKSPDIRTLQNVTELYATSLEKYQNLSQSLNEMLKLIDNESEIVNNINLKSNFINLKIKVKQKIKIIDKRTHELQLSLTSYQQQLKKLLAVRQSLSEYKMSSWPAIASQLVLVPSQLLGYLNKIFFKTMEAFIWLAVSVKILLVTTILILIGTALWIRRLCIQALLLGDSNKLMARFVDIFRYVLFKNIGLLFLIAAMLLIFYITQISYNLYQLLIRLLVVITVFRALIILARVVLLERSSETEPEDVSLFYRLKWLLLIGVWSTGLMLIGHWLPLSVLLQDLFNRIFMSFLVAASLVSWRSIELIQHLLHPILKNKKRYIRHAVIMLIYLFPITLFSTALIGLIGYMNLAWTMSIYQMKLLLIIAGYVMVRGLMFELLDWLSEQMIKSLTSGWLLIEIFIKPLDKVLRAILIVLSFVVMFRIFGWGAESEVVKQLSIFYNYQILNISGIHITPKSITEFIILMFFFSWVAKWTREFCYRWLYRDTKDTGLRNSLSVFTQYGIVIIGVVLSLHTLGIDLTGMSMILGGLAVGMGFGLRDFASNIVGGIMLLIERPVREGDLVTIGDYEGKVAHIGIRSMRVSSWDNMEVLIPNAETFNKPFTNWTHQDSIVRTVVPIKVSREDDPLVVRQIILDVLEVIPEILLEPQYQVILTKIDEALIEFEIRYFINVDQYARFEIRSKLLFTLMERFKHSGIRAPIPPIAVEMKDAK